MIAAMAASTVLLTLGLALSLATTIETGIAAHQRAGLQALLAADAALEHASGELARTPDWSAVLRGDARSALYDGAGAGLTLPGGGTLDLDAETSELRCGDRGGCADAAMDAATAARPWGRNNPRWRVYASGPLDPLQPDQRLLSHAYVVVWVGDDPDENDADPLADGRPPAVADARNPVNPGRDALALRVHAYGGSGSRRVVEAVLERDHRFVPARVRLRVWREVT